MARGYTIATFVLLLSIALADRITLLEHVKNILLLYMNDSVIITFPLESFSGRHLNRLQTSPQLIIKGLDILIS